MAQLERDGKIRVNVRITPEMQQKVAKLAYEMGAGVSTVFVIVMAQYLKGLEVTDAMNEVARKIRVETMKLSEGAQ